MKSLQTSAELQIDGWAYVWFPGKPMSMRDIPEASIKIPILRFESPDFAPTWQFASINYYSRYEYTMPDSLYAIAPNSLPSLESLLRAYLTTRRDYYGELGPFAGLHKTIRDFVEAYCILPGTMPLVRPSKYVREASLTRFIQNRRDCCPRLSDCNAFLTCTDKPLQ